VSVGWYLFFSAAVFVVMAILRLPTVFFVGYAAIAVGGFFLMLRDRQIVNVVRARPTAQQSAAAEAAMRDLIGNYLTLNEEWQLYTTGQYEPPESFAAMDAWSLSPNGRLWVRLHENAKGDVFPCPSANAHRELFGAAPG
jgi:hypothetical protein